MDQANLLLFLDGRDFFLNVISNGILEIRLLFRIPILSLAHCADEEWHRKKRRGWSPRSSVERQFLGSKSTHFVSYKEWDDECGQENENMKYEKAGTECYICSFPGLSRDSSTRRPGLTCIGEKRIGFA